jgi:hypothetical protein
MALPLLGGLNPVSGIVDSVAGAVTGIGGMIFGNKQQEDQQAAQELLAVTQGYNAEFAAKEKDSIFDEIVDGCNRLVRPFFTFGTIALFVWCVWDPTRFAVSMQALTLMPTQLWYILGAIVTFWFGSRILLDKAMAASAPPSPQQVQGVISAQAAITTASQAQKLDKFVGTANIGKLTAPASGNPAVVSWTQKFKQGS